MAFINCKLSKEQFKLCSQKSIVQYASSYCASKELTITRSFSTKFFSLCITWYPQVQGKKLTSSISNCSIHNGHYVIKYNQTEQSRHLFRTPANKRKINTKIISTFTSVTTSASEACMVIIKRREVKQVKWKIGNETKTSGGHQINRRYNFLQVAPETDDVSGNC